jgi:hypothetical protein
MKQKLADRWFLFCLTLRDRLFVPEVPMISQLIAYLCLALFFLCVGIICLGFVSVALSIALGG